MFQLQSRYIGFDIGKSSLRFAVLRKTRGQWKVSALKEISSDDSIHLLREQFKEDVLVSAMNTRDVLTRPCEMPLKKAKDIFAALDFHVEPLLPYSIDKGIIQSQIVNAQENTTLLNIFATRKDHLSQHLESLKNYLIEPDIVTTRAHALAALSTFLPQNNSTLLIVHEGEEELSIILIEKGQVLAARSIDAKKELTSEIQKNLLSLASSHKSKPFESICFFGKNPELKNILTQLSDKPVLPPSAPSLSLTQEELIHFGLAIGVARAHQEINFRQNEFTYPHRFKRLKKPLALFFALSFLLASSVCIFGEMSLFQKKQKIERAYYTLIKSEKSLGYAFQIYDTPQAYLSALNVFEKELRGRPETFPLLPQVPKVKEVLSWLTAQLKPQGKENHGIMIESVHYQMVKRPDFPHKQEHYKVRIDLEFSAKDPNAARDFQDVLKNSQSLVDTDEEIQWLPSKGKYKASFYLKDKTRYG